MALLQVDDVMLLDCYSQVFVWVGVGANRKEREQAMNFAQKYVAEAVDGRDADAPIMKVSSSDVFVWGPSRREFL